tara:strand:+ start:233 stop:1201 length:969 start_codon:yes stop_codon:yes gene_type:complete
MASTPKNICTHDTEQTITAKKTFTDSIVANRFELVDGTVINPPAIEIMEKNVMNRLVVGAGSKKLGTTTDILLSKDAVVVSKEVTAPKFKGDGSGLTALQSSQLEGSLPLEQLKHDSRGFEVVESALALRVDSSSPLCMTKQGLSLTFADTPAVSDANKFDHILVNSTRQGVGRLSVSSLMGHIASMNNHVLNIVNDGEILGRGVSLYKGKTNKGRNQLLQFKTLVFDENFTIEETENEISISITDLRLQEVKDEQEKLQAEISALGAQRQASRLETIKALEEQISMTLRDMDKTAKEYQRSVKEGKAELKQLMSTLAHIDE